MECQALGPIKGQMALVADDGGFAELIVVRAGCGLVPVTRTTSSPLARMVCGIVVVIATVALVTPIALVDEPSDGGTPLVMIV